MNNKSVEKSKKTEITAKLKELFSEYIMTPDNKRKLLDFGHKAAMDIVGNISDGVSDKNIPFLNRYDNDGFLEGNGYFLSSPHEDAKWYLGYAKASVVPPYIDGECYIGGYLSYPPNKMNGIMNEQMIRAVAISDNSGRGIHIFAVIDCIGISGTDIRKIRKSLQDVISEKNILSINISATHCHSGIDTEGLWGDLPKSIKNNKKALKSGKPEDTISGKNNSFMNYLINTAQDTVRLALSNMKEGKLYYAQLPAERFVRDKRPPFVTVNDITSLVFVPQDGSKRVNAVFFAAHPVSYGAKQREAARDYPGYLCDKMEKEGVEALFIQGAQAAVATQRGKFSPEGATLDEGIRVYGETLADYILSFDLSSYKEIPPLINVTLSELFIEPDNKILELAAKLRLVNNSLTKVSTSDTDKDKYSLSLVTEVGFAVLGNVLTVAMVPGELMPEIAIGGSFPDWASYNGTEWNKPSFKDIFNTDIAVAGLCNDFIGYIIPDNDYGSVFAPLHYEEAVSAGKKTASEIVSAFERLKKNSEKITVTGSQALCE